MNDDELPARAEMASAYLDGELDTAERASVSADTDTMAMVEAFAQVRNALGNVAPVNDDVKASALSAALAQFDAVQVSASRTPVHVASRVTSLHPHRVRAYRLLTGLAAAAVVLVVAIAALNSLKGSDSKSSASATEPPAAADSQAGSPVLKAATAPAGTTAPGVLATEIAPLAPPINNANDLARYAASLARDTSAPAATTAAASGAYGGASPASTPGPAPAIPPATCLSATDTVLGPISVLGTPAFAIRDTATGAVRAIAASNCQVLIPAP